MCSIKGFLPAGALKMEPNLNGLKSSWMLCTKQCAFEVRKNSWTLFHSVLSGIIPRNTDCPGLLVRFVWTYGKTSALQISSSWPENIQYRNYCWQQLTIMKKSQLQKLFIKKKYNIFAASKMEEFADTLSLSFQI